MSHIQLDESVYQILHPDPDVGVEVAWKTLDAFVTKLHVEAQLCKLVDTWNDQLCLELLKRPRDDVESYVPEVIAQRNLIRNLHPMPCLRA